MKKFIILLTWCLILFSQPYKPKPILFIHGRSGSSITWGVVPDSVSYITWFDLLPGVLRIPQYNPSTDTILKDSIRSDGTYAKFLPLLKLYAKTWFFIDSSYTWTDTQLSYPNKSFLEIFNADGLFIFSQNCKNGNFCKWENE